MKVELEKQIELLNKLDIEISAWGQGNQDQRNTVIGILEAVRDYNGQFSSILGDKLEYARIQIEKDRERIVKNSSPFDLSKLIDNTPINLD